MLIQDFGNYSHAIAPLKKCSKVKCCYGGLCIRNFMKIQRTVQDMKLTEFSCVQRSKDRKVTLKTLKMLMVMFYVAAINSYLGTIIFLLGCEYDYQLGIKRTIKPRKILLAIASIFLVGFGTSVINSIIVFVHLIKVYGMSNINLFEMRVCDVSSVK